MEVAPSLLSPGGRMVAISFHSLEDRFGEAEFSLLEARRSVRSAYAADREAVARRDQKESSKPKR